MGHAWRPLAVAFAFILLILIVRIFVVPSDFMAKNGDYKYQWHRVSNEKDWKDFPVGYRGREFCGQCHPDKLEAINKSKHRKVECENCHVLPEAKKSTHPVNLQKSYKYKFIIGINKTRHLCLRCHQKLPYRPSVYRNFAKPVEFKMQDGEKHNPGMPCITCHDVHKASFK